MSPIKTSTRSWMDGHPKQVTRVKKADNDNGNCKVIRVFFSLSIGFVEVLRIEIVLASCSVYLYSPINHDSRIAMVIAHMD